MSNMIFKSPLMTHFSNDKADPKNIYTEQMKSILKKESAEQAVQHIQHWPNYQHTPLHQLNGLANHLNIGMLYYKNESNRFELKSFKSLGGSYAVAMQLQHYIAQQTGKKITIPELFSGQYASVVQGVTVATATDGNHGKSVAWGARMFGCACEIYIHADVSAGREQSMKDLGATVTRMDGNYDDSVKEVAEKANKEGWIIVSDNSYEGYMEIPKDVMLGYSVMMQEIVEQLEGDIPTHVFIQGGCGGLASTVCGYFWDVWGGLRPRMVIVEPEQANCLQLSAVNKTLTVVDGKLETYMAGLACGEVSLLAWEILEAGTDDFMTINESLIPKSMKMLAEGLGNDPKIEAGESAVAGVAGLMATLNDANARARLGLTERSRVLVIGTEGATDPELYHALIQ